MAKGAMAKNSKPLVAIWMLVFLVKCAQCDMSFEQMMKTGETMRNVCQPKFKVADEQLEEIRQKRFPDDKKVKCYTNCLLEMMGSIKKGKVQYDATMRQIDTLVPNDLKPAFKQGANACKDAAVGIKDNCEAAYALLKCFVDNNPKFVFP